MRYAVALRRVLARPGALALIAIGALAAVSCGGDDDSNDNDAPTATSVVRTPGSSGSPTPAPSPTQQGEPCAGGQPSEPSAQELLINPGFERGNQGWASLTTEDWEPRFDIATDVKRSGACSAYLRMRTRPDMGAIRIFGMTQEITPEVFPEELSGYYRVENWQRATGKQYLQVVVIVFGAENRPNPASFPNHQIRYELAGIGEPPFAIANAQFIFTNTGEPAQGEWVPFRFDLAQDFARLWGAVPVNFEKIRVLFEVRWDDRQPAEQPSADVYYDDLHLGAAAGGPP